MAFSDYYSELMGQVPRIDPLLSQLLVKRAWREIKDERIWSWLIAEGTLFSPALISSGSVTVTQFSTTVNLDATANAALNNLTNPLITKRQFRIGGGPLYNISSYSNLLSTLTLERNYLEATSTGSYQVYRCYYDPPDTDFLTFIAILNPGQGYVIVGPNLRYSKAEIDSIDPQRGSQDWPYRLASYRADTVTGSPTYELWPHPVSEQGYPCLYRKRGPNLSSTQDIPSTVQPDVLVTKSLDLAYNWAIANSGRYQELKGVDWRLLKAENKRSYEKLLNLAKRLDDELMLQSWLSDWFNRYGFPIDAKFMQSHDLGLWGL